MLPASAIQAKPIKTTRKCHFVYRIYLKDRGCWGKRRAFDWYSPLIVSHATNGILLPFTSLIRDLGTELCTLSAKLCGCNFVAGMLNQLNFWYQHLLLTIPYNIFQNNLFEKMNLHKHSEPHYKQNIFRK